MKMKNGSNLGHFSAWLVKHYWKLIFLLFCFCSFEIINISWKLNHTWACVLWEWTTLHKWIHCILLFFVILETSLIYPPILASSYDTLAYFLWFDFLFKVIYKCIGIISFLSLSHHDYGPSFVMCFSWMKPVQLLFFLISYISIFPLSVAFIVLQSMRGLQCIW